MADHSFEDCRVKVEKMIKEAGEKFLKTATYWKSILSGFVVILGMTVASIWTGVAWANNITTTVRVNSMRLTTLEAEMEQIMELRNKLEVAIVAQKQSIEQEQSLIAVLKDRLR
jgi:hypothetical protein